MQISKNNWSQPLKVSYFACKLFAFAFSGVSVFNIRYFEWDFLKHAIRSKWKLSLDNERNALIKKHVKKLEPLVQQIWTAVQLQIIVGVSCHVHAKADGAVTETTNKNNSCSTRANLKQISENIMGQGDSLSFSLFLDLNLKDFPPAAELQWRMSSWWLFHG